MSDSKQWKQKFEEVSAVLNTKQKLLTQYADTIKKSDELIKKIMDKLATELKIAHQIHRILLPVELPIIHNCEFSFKFNPADTNSQSKDFYEVFSYPRVKSFNIVMSSCSSYSLSALLFSSRLKMMSHKENLQPLKPHEFINHLVKEVNLDTTTGKNKETNKDKVSLFYALIDQKTYKMSYCLVGDITALVQYADSGDIKVIKSLAPSLNFKKINKLKTQELILNRKDRVILCSPGVLDCLSIKGDSYSLARLKKSLKQNNTSTVHKIRNQIFYELESFAKGQPSQKDQSVLVMEIKKTILKLAHNE